MPDLPIDSLEGLSPTELVGLLQRRPKILDVRLAE
jgi:hypothetical protein